MIVYLICGFNKGMGTSLEEKQFALSHLMSFMVRVVNVCNDPLPSVYHFTRGHRMDKSLLTFEGCNFFRQRLVLSTLSCRPVRIIKIRKDDEDPGIKGKIELFSDL